MAVAAAVAPLVCEVCIKHSGLTVELLTDAWLPQSLHVNRPENPERILMFGPCV